MRINAAGIDHADAAPRDGRHGKAPIFAAGRKQLNRVACADFERIRQPRTDDDGVRVVAKFIERPRDDLLREIGGLEVVGGIDAEEIDSCILETGARTEGAAQDRRAGGHVRELPADPHDLGRVRNAAEVVAAGQAGGVAPGSFRRHHQSGGAGLETRVQHERAVTPERRVDKIFREALRLRLRANENGHAENNAAQAQDKCALAMAEEADRNVERRRHFCSGRGAIFATRCRTNFPGRNLS